MSGTLFGPRECEDIIELLTSLEPDVVTGLHSLRTSAAELLDDEP
jgi:hypothetical protein